MAKSKHNKTGNGTHRERTRAAREALELSRKMAELQELQDKLQKQLQQTKVAVGEAKEMVNTLTSEMPIMPVMAEEEVAAE
jgi:two-component SAPR family response regulator